MIFTSKKRRQTEISVLIQYAHVHMYLVNKYVTIYHCKKYWCNCKTIVQRFRLMKCFFTDEWEYQFWAVYTRTSLLCFINMVTRLRHVSKRTRHMCYTLKALWLHEVVYFWLSFVLSQHVYVLSINYNWSVDWCLAMYQQLLLLYNG